VKGLKGCSPCQETEAADRAAKTDRCSAADEHPNGQNRFHSDDERRNPGELIDQSEADASGMVERVRCLGRCRNQQDHRENPFDASVAFCHEEATSIAGDAADIKK
jgi:hypothetical protein